MFVSIKQSLSSDWNLNRTYSGPDDEDPARVERAAAAGEPGAVQVTPPTAVSSLQTAPCRYPWHASCSVDWQFGEPCPAVRDKILQQIAAWQVGLGLGIVYHCFLLKSLLCRVTVCAPGPAPRVPGCRVARTACTS